MSMQTAPARPAPASSRNGTTDPGPLHAAHTPNFPGLLRQLGASLLVTTYQAGKLVMVRDEGDHLNTHYRSFPSPMGLALADGERRGVSPPVNDANIWRTYRRANAAYAAPLAWQVLHTRLPAYPNDLRCARTICTHLFGTPKSINRHAQCRSEAAAVFLFSVPPAAVTLRTCPT